MTAHSIPIGGIDLASTFGTLASLTGDPTVRLQQGLFERATVTPDGSATIAVSWHTDQPDARVEAHGDGADWLLERAPQLLGCRDDVTGFEPTTPPLRDLWRRHCGDRIPRTGTLWHDLAWLIVQQRVSRVDAAEQWRRLVNDLGAPAPAIPSLMAPPEPTTVARLGYHHFHRYGIERRRADNLLHAARAAVRFQTLVDDDVDAVMPALRSVRGIGAWTASCVATQTWGDRDAVIVGDSGIPSIVAWLLARERRADDHRLLELLEQYRPHRYRVIRLAFASGIKPPRRHHRARRIDIRQR